MVGLFVLGSAAAAFCAPDAAPERLAEGYGFTEGPAWDGTSRLYFVDVVGQKIFAFDDHTKEVHLVREDSGGAAGLVVDPRGRLLATEARGQRVVRIELDGSVTVLASRWDGKRFNSPNDLVLDRRGGVYFSDPRYRDRDQMELDVEAVYYIAPDGTTQQVINDLVRPNGVVLSPDEKTLYVADHGASTIWAYDVQPDGGVENGRVFARPPGAPDGLAVDGVGNLFVAAGLGITILDPAGKIVETLAMPRPPRNCTLGGSDNRDLYVTADTSLYRIKLPTPR